MTQYISKSALLAEIKKKIKQYEDAFNNPAFASYEASLIAKGKYRKLLDILQFINTLEVVDPYEQWCQHDSIKSGIQAHAETYSFNIESELYNQLTTKEQQKLWRKEIEQACISGGEVGVNLAKDPRYKENLEVKDVDLEKEMENWIENNQDNAGFYNNVEFAKHFFELGLSVRKASK